MMLAAIKAFPPGMKAQGVFDICRCSTDTELPHLTLEDIIALIASARATGWFTIVFNNDDTFVHVALTPDEVPKALMAMLLDVTSDGLIELHNIIRDNSFWYRMLGVALSDISHVDVNRVVDRILGMHTITSNAGMDREFAAIRDLIYGIYT